MNLYVGNSGGYSKVIRATTKDGGNQYVHGSWASSSSSYPDNSYAVQGAQRGTDYAKYEDK